MYRVMAYDGDRQVWRCHACRRSERDGLIALRGLGLRAGSPVALALDHGPDDPIEIVTTSHPDAATLAVLPAFVTAVRAGS